MALTITWDGYVGVGETKNDDITNFVFGNSDTNDFTPMDYPITAGNASYGKYLKVDFAGMVAEGVTEVQNAKIHKSAGAYVTGEDLTYKGLGPVAYATPATADLGDTTIETATPGSQNLGLGASDTGSLTADGSSDYLRMQATTTGATPNGAFNNKTIMVTYDVV